MENVSELSGPPLAIAGPLTSSDSPSSYRDIQAHQALAMPTDEADEIRQCSLGTSSEISHSIYLLFLTFRREPLLVHAKQQHPFLSSDHHTKIS